MRKHRQNRRRPAKVATTALPALLGCAGFPLQAQAAQQDTWIELLGSAGVSLPLLAVLGVCLVLVLAFFAVALRRSHKAGPTALASGTAPQPQPAATGPDTQKTDDEAEVLQAKAPPPVDAFEADTETLLPLFEEAQPVESPVFELESSLPDGQKELETRAETATIADKQPTMDDIFAAEPPRGTANAGAPATDNRQADFHPEEQAAAILYGIDLQVQQALASIEAAFGEEGLAALDTGPLSAPPPETLDDEAPAPGRWVYHRRFERQEREPAPAAGDETKPGSWVYSSAAKPTGKQEAKEATPPADVWEALLQQAADNALAARLKTKDVAGAPAQPKPPAAAPALAVERDVPATGTPAVAGTGKTDTVAEKPGETLEAANPQPPGRPKAAPQPAEPAKPDTEMPQAPARRQATTAPLPAEPAAVVQPRGDGASAVQPGTQLAFAAAPGPPRAEASVAPPPTAATDDRMAKPQAAPAKAARKTEPAPEEPPAGGKTAQGAGAAIPPPAAAPKAKEPQPATATAQQAKPTEDAVAQPARLAEEAVAQQTEPAEKAAAQPAEPAEEAVAQQPEPAEETVAQPANTPRAPAAGRDARPHALPYQTTAAPATKLDGSQAAGKIREKQQQLKAAQTPAAATTPAPGRPKRSEMRKKPVALSSFSHPKRPRRTMAVADNPPKASPPAATRTLSPVERRATPLHPGRPVVPGATLPRNH